MAPWWHFTNGQDHQGNDGLRVRAEHQKHPGSRPFFRSSGSIRKSRNDPLFEKVILKQQKGVIRLRLHKKIIHEVGRDFSQVIQLATFLGWLVG